MTSPIYICDQPQIQRRERARVRRFECDELKRRKTLAKYTVLDAGGISEDSFRWWAKTSSFCAEYSILFHIRMNERHSELKKFSWHIFYSSRSPKIETSSNSNCSSMLITPMRCPSIRNSTCCPNEVVVRRFVMRAFRKIHIIYIPYHQQLIHLYVFH